MLGLTKRGNSTIRMLLIQGARIVTRYVIAKGRESTVTQKWLQSVVMRRGKHIAAVALANKMARIIWNLLAKKEEYYPAA